MIIIPSPTKDQTGVHHALDTQFTVSVEAISWKSLIRRYTELHAQGLIATASMKLVRKDSKPAAWMDSYRFILTRLVYRFEHPRPEQPRPKA
jgi:hypothetical protein